MLSVICSGIAGEVIEDLISYSNHPWAYEILYIPIIQDLTLVQDSLEVTVIAL